MLTTLQKRKFVDDGYLLIPGAIPQVLIDAALRAVNQSIGDVGLGGEDMARNRSAFHCAELLSAPVILDLFNKTPVIEIAEALMGAGNVLPVETAKPYPRFPLPVGEDPPAPRGHIDGVGNGTNGMAKGEHQRGFTAFAVVYLADVPEPYSGNFTVWPKSHRVFANHFKSEGYEVLEKGIPQLDLPEGPNMITAKAGDLIIAHHQIFHGACANGSPHVRQAVITRLRHKDVVENGYDAYTDLWREWPGVHQYIQEDLEPDYVGDFTTPALADSGIVCDTRLFYNTAAHPRRVWICTCGEVLLWSGDTMSADNSQHISDPYTFTPFCTDFSSFGCLRSFCPNFR